MLNRLCIALLVVVSFHVSVLEASSGDADPRYRVCVKECEETGCIRQNGVAVDGLWYVQEPLYLKWKQWDCQSDCRYNCMVEREKQREALGSGPVKYHGKWPFKRVHGLQEPVSVVFSVLNLAMHFHGWMVDVFILLNYKLPRTKDKKAYPEYGFLWNVCGLFSMNSWFWSAVFHSRDVDFTEKLDYSSAVAVHTKELHCHKGGGQKENNTTKAMPCEDSLYNQLTTIKLPTL